MHHLLFGPTSNTAFHQETGVTHSWKRRQFHSCHTWLQEFCFVMLGSSKTIPWFLPKYCVVASKTRWYSSERGGSTTGRGDFDHPKNGGSVFAGYTNPSCLKLPRAQFLCCRSNKLQKVRKVMGLYHQSLIWESGSTQLKLHSSMAWKNHHLGWMSFLFMAQK